MAGRSRALGGAARRRDYCPRVRLFLSERTEVRVAREVHAVVTREQPEGSVNGTFAEPWKDQAGQVAQRVRAHAVAIADRHNGGYLGQVCSSAEILATLYVRLLDLGPPIAAALTLDGAGATGAGPIWGGGYNGPQDPAKDRFILSPAHYATALYATLAETGRLDPRALDGFGEDGSVLEMIGAEYSPGFETTTGSLGQGLSVAVGQAIARRRRGDRGRIWVMLSDGELQEGQTWEALQTAPSFGLDNLTVLLDANGYQVDGPIERAIAIDPIASKIAAFGWSVAEVDGHDVAAIAAAAESRELDRPRFVICRTDPWHGIPTLLARRPDRLHFVRFRPGEAAAARRDLAGHNVATRTAL